MHILNQAEAREAVRKHLRRYVIRHVRDEEFIPDLLFLRSTAFDEVPLHEDRSPLPALSNLHKAVLALASTVFIPLSLSRQEEEPQRRSNRAKRKSRGAKR